LRRLIIPLHDRQLGLVDRAGGGPDLGWRNRDQ
jgi:hypothetical protein